ncbi:MAG: ABC transporter ATP-binding protein [Aestuariivita sp.]|nr:ABC transporter ATP-binding protein [Aestuariivita sp.]MCY4201350.1 ABC transporter ATP-binding protein [Aestuariivita sp.]
MSDPILSLTDVHFSLRSNAGVVPILRGVTFVVAREQTVALVGPSGSGKTSLLMLIGGLEQATLGKVLVFGHDLSKMNEDALAEFRRNHMGVIFQSFNLIPTMTALENVATALELIGNDDPFKRAQAELKAVGLAKRADHYPRQLSGGEQQRVALARASVTRPKVILADEPTGNLDSAISAEIVKLLFWLRDQHQATLVIATHSRRLAAECDQIIRLQDGRITMTPGASS